MILKNADCKTAAHLQFVIYDHLPYQMKGWSRVCLMDAWHYCVHCNAEPMHLPFMPLWHVIAWNSMRKNTTLTNGVLRLWWQVVRMDFNKCIWVKSKEVFTSKTFFYKKITINIIINHVKACAFHNVAKISLTSQPHVLIYQSKFATL